MSDEIEREYGFRCGDCLVTVGKAAGKWVVSEGGEDMPPEAARAFARLLTAAADEADRLNGAGEPRVRRFRDRQGWEWMYDGQSMVVRTSPEGRWIVSGSANPIDLLQNEAKFGVVEITDHEDGRQ